MCPRRGTGSSSLDQADLPHLSGSRNFGYNLHGGSHCRAPLDGKDGCNNDSDWDSRDAVIGTYGLAAVRLQQGPNHPSLLDLVIRQVSVEHPSPRVPWQYLDPHDLRTYSTLKDHTLN